MVQLILFLDLVMDWLFCPRSWYFFNFLCIKILFAWVYCFINCTVVIFWILIEHDQDLNPRVSGFEFDHSTIELTHHLQICIFVVVVANIPGGVDSRQGGKGALRGTVEEWSQLPQVSASGRTTGKGEHWRSTDSGNRSSQRKGKSNYRKDLITRLFKTVKKCLNPVR